MAQSDPAQASPAERPQGAGSYRIKPGDCLDKIAFEWGFFWETIWNDAANSRLREVRKDPFVLLPGDRVHIREKERRHESGATEMRHRFRKRGAPSYLRVTLLEDNEPRANEPYILEIDGQLMEGSTDAQGKLRHPIPPNAREGRLQVPAMDLEYSIDLGYIDPIEAITGVQGRLRNLGIYTGPVDGNANPELHDAIARFQEQQGLQPTGEMTSDTRDRLKRIYGS